MNLNLDTRLNSEEQNEIKRRVFSIMEQMFLEGISAGREMAREELHYETEKYISDKISFLSNYFIQDKVWSEQPPANYREKKVIPEYDADNSDFEGRIEKVEEGKKINVDTEISADNKPQWAKDEVKPEWTKKDRPFT